MSRFYIHVEIHALSSAEHPPMWKKSILGVRWETKGDDGDKISLNCPAIH